MAAECVLVLFLLEQLETPSADAALIEFTFALQEGFESG
jgi:hypothetical protein